MKKAIFQAEGGGSTSPAEDGETTYSSSEINPGESKGSGFSASVGSFHTSAPQITGSISLSINAL